MVSVHSKNPFDLLAADDQEPVAVAQEKKAPAAASAKPAAAPVKKQSANDRKPARAPRNGYAPRGGHANKSALYQPREQQEEGGERLAPRGDRPVRDARDKTDHRRGARGGNQGGRGRLYDRHSGGHRDSDKKASQGWGSATETLEEGAPAADAEKAAEETVVEDPEAAAAAAEARRLQEEEEKQKTLDQYLAEKAQAARAVVLPTARQANEGADSSQWKDAVVFERVEEEESLFAGKESAKGKNRKERSAKTTVEIEQRFSRPPRVDRGERDNHRGGRDGHRGGRGGNRGDRSVRTDRSLNMGDESAFPTLK